MKNITTLAFILLAGASMAQKELIVTATPQAAELYRKLNNGGEVKMGANPATVKLEKDVPFIVEARLSGYVSVTRTFIRNDKEFRTDKAKNPHEKIELTERIITLNTSPADCHIFANGADRGKAPLDIVIPQGQSISVEVKKSGFVTQSRTFYNKEGQDDPTTSHLFKLEDRTVSLKTIPNDATIYIDDKRKGEGNADVIITKEKCAEVRVERVGYVTFTATYCNKENEPAPPLSDQIRLKTRLVQINPQPDDAIIIIDGKEVGKGGYTLKLAEDQCVKVMVKKDGYMSETLTLCNKEGMQTPDLTLTPKLNTDEAYSESAESDKANRNFNVEINPDMKELDAWKVLNSIVQTYFDEIETVDASTGYLKTNWAVGKFNGNATIVRTRIVVTTASIAPLKYNLKIQSESTDNPTAKVTENKSECVNPPITRDDCFYPWPRILRKYNDFIMEVQRRLQAK